jgi:CheY-like chemotaxis protein
MAPATLRRPPALRVLLAEDDPEMRALLATSLRSDGHQVVEACDGRDLAARIGRDRAGANAYDVIVSDVSMPGANGLMVLTGVAADAAAPPVIVITAFGDDDLHAWARKIGAIALFDKPFEIDDLRTLLANLPERPRAPAPWTA